MMILLLPGQTMPDYTTSIVIDDPQNVVLTNLPFKRGQKVNIQINVVEDDVNLVERWKTLLKKTQALHADNPLTDEEIAAEIQAYRQEE